MFSQTFVVYNKNDSLWAYGPLLRPNFEKMKMNLFKTWASMLAIFVPFFLRYNVLIPSPPCFSVCFSMHASFHIASKFLPQDISSSRIPLVEVMSYRDSTFVPKGHQTYEEIKDLSEKCQREKKDCLAKEFVFEITRIILFGKPTLWFERFERDMGEVESREASRVQGKIWGDSLVT